MGQQVKVPKNIKHLERLNKAMNTLFLGMILSESQFDECGKRLAKRIEEAVRDETN